MIELAFIILAPPLFVFLWKFIEKCPGLFARISSQMQKRQLLETMLLVFSASTANNREAEFIDNRPLAGRRLIRRLRALLIFSYLLFAFYMLKRLQ